MADDSQPGTSTGSGNVINNISESQIGIFNQHNHLTGSTSTKVDIDYCPAPVATFLGRSKELKTLKTMFTRHQVVALVGMGGLGKTQLSRKYVQVNKADYKYKYWLESETPEKLENSFKELAKILNIESDNINKVVNDVYKKIGAIRTILVFDNVEKSKHVYPYLPTRVVLPSGVTIHVLVTSRWTDWTCDKQIECYKLQPMNVSESLQIFEEIFDKRCIKTMQKEWKELAETLGYLPLALQVATSYIYKRYQHNPDLPLVLADYMKQLKEGANRLLNDPLTEYGNRSVYASMMLTLQQLENKADVANVKNNVQWKFAVTIINAVAYMDPDWIQKKYLLKLVDNHENICKLDEALEILMAYSLVNQGVDWDGDRIYSVHRIIQSSMRHNQTLMGTADTYYTEALKYIAPDDYKDVLQYANKRASAVAVYCKDNPSPTILKYLVTNNAIATMKAVLKLSKNQIQITMNEHVLLHYAVKSGDLNMAQLLCKYGADINQPAYMLGESPLNIALMTGYLEIATWLLKNGATPTVRNCIGRNALHVAIIHANHKIVPSIIKKDRAVVNATDCYGQTPLHFIHYSDNEQDIFSTTSVLVRNGADTTVVEEHGNTVLHVVTRCVCAAAVSLILQRNIDLINIKNRDGATALHVIPYNYAVIDDERILSTIRVFDESGADFIKVDKRGNTVLHSAAEGARAAAVSFILQLHIDLIDIKNRDGATALHVIPYYYTDIIDDVRILSTMRVLVDNGGDLTKVDMRGNTVLHSAAKGLCAAAVSFILQINNDLINIKNRDCRTALHVLGYDFDFRLQYSREKVERQKFFACVKETARVLIMNGLSLATRDITGRTPLNTAKPGIKDILLKVAAECNNQLPMLPVKRQGTE